jgi:hypothetical protein
MSGPDDEETPAVPIPVGSDVFPAAIRAAGIIWVASALLGILHAAVLFASDPLGNRGGIEWCGQCCLCGTVNLVFLAIGYETINWRIRWTTAANGVVSIIVGWAHAALAVLVIQAALGGRPARPFEVYSLGVVSAVLSIALIVAGVLALVGWRRYSLQSAEMRASDMSQEQADFDELLRDPADEDEE